MTPRTMTEPEAWREIARRIVEGKWNKYGLCGEAADLYVRLLVTGNMATAMCERVRPHVLSTSGRQRGYAYPAGTEPEARALAALWLALEAEEEGA
jgi:hypothetical protein